MKDRVCDGDSDAIRTDTGIPETGCPITRRHALRIVVRGGLVLVGGSLLEGVSRAVPQGAKPQWVAVGPVNRFKVGVPVKVMLPQGASAYVVRQAGNRWLALSAVCTHSGGTVQWDGAKKRFLCPLHQATFAPDGRNTGGPARGPLAKLQSQVRGSQLQINAAQAASAGGGRRGKGEHEGEEEEQEEHGRKHGHHDDEHKGRKGREGRDDD